MNTTKIRKAKGTKIFFLIMAILIPIIGISVSVWTVWGELYFAVRRESLRYLTEVLKELSKDFLIYVSIGFILGGISRLAGIMAADAPEYSAQPVAQQDFCGAACAQPEPAPCPAPACAQPEPAPQPAPVENDRPTCSCGTVLIPGMRFCTNCGKDRLAPVGASASASSVQTDICPYCGTENPLTNPVCSKCKLTYR